MLRSEGTLSGGGPGRVLIVGWSLQKEDLMIRAVEMAVERRRPQKASPGTKLELIDLKSLCDTNGRGSQRSGLQLHLGEANH